MGIIKIKSRVVFGKKCMRYCNFVLDYMYGMGIESFCYYLYIYIDWIFCSKF